MLKDHCRESRHPALSPSRHGDGDGFPQITPELWPPLCLVGSIGKMLV